MRSIPHGLATEHRDDGSVSPETPDSAGDDHDNRTLEWLTDAHFTVDGAWRFLEVSPRATEFVGLPTAALLGQVLWDVFPAALGTVFERECRAAMQSRLPRRCERYSLEHLGLTADVLFQPDPRGLRVYYRDITDRERTQAALQQSEAKYRKVMSLLPAAVYMCDAAGLITLFNAQAAALWGREPRLFDQADRYCGSFRLYGANRQPMEHDDCWMALALRTGASFRSEKLIIERPDGSKVQVLANVDPLFDDQGELIGAINILQDVSEQHQAEQALEELNQTLEQRVAERTAEAQQLADQLRALAAELTQVEHRERRRLALLLHDHVQQLLVAAKMQVEAIGRGASPGPVSLAADRTSSILKDAIAASRTLSVELSPPILHQSGLAAGLAWLAEHFEAKHGFKVHFRDESQAEPTTEEVRLLLFESTRELLFNCIKHSGVDEAHVRLTRTEAGQLKLVVEDKGRGFEPPSPSAKTIVRRSLGLFSIQQRLTYLGGRMEIEGAPGAGVRVTLTGPA